MLYAKLAAAVLQRTTEDTDPKFWSDANPLIAFLYGSAALLSYYFLCFSPIFFTNTPSPNISRLTFLTLTLITRLIKNMKKKSTIYLKYIM
jgi:hypothetical protein